MHPLLFTSHGCFSELSIHVILAVIFFFQETIELSKVIMFYGGIVFPMIMVMGCLWFMWLFIGSWFVLCLSLTLCLTVSLSAFELLIVSTLVQWWLASNHYFLLVSWLTFIWVILPKYHMCNSQNYAFVNYGDNFSGGHWAKILVSHWVIAVDLLLNSEIDVISFVIF